jgi:hypothetical protein
MSNDQPDDFEWIAFIAKLEAAEEEFAQAPRRIQRFGNCVRLDRQERSGFFLTRVKAIETLRGQIFQL